MRVNNIHTCILILLTVLVCLTAVPAAAQPVAGRVLDGVSMKVQDEKIAVRINFNFPVRYISHFPDQAGRELRIQIQSINVSTDDLSALNKRESLTPQQPNLANIVEVIYEGDSYSKLFATVYFHDKAEYTVKQGSDYRSIQLLVEPPALSGNYAINLESSVDQIDLAEVTIPDSLQIYTLYSTSSRIDGQLWHRLRLGFFPTEQVAQEALQQLQESFPQAWVTKAPQADRQAAARIAAGEVPAQPAEPAEQARPARPLPAERIQQLLAEGKQAMLDEDFRRAVQIYTRLGQTGDPEVSPQALEYLGLARERSDQLAHARAVYERYLTLYPDGEGADRVKQRLAGVLSAQAAPRGELRPARGQAADSSQWTSEVYGSFSQFYDRDESYTNNEDTVINRSTLMSDVDLNARFRSEDFDIRTTFVGGYENDFLDEDDNEERISSLYVDVLAHQLNLSTRVGRQSRSSGGVLGRFDGALLSWQALEQVGVNVVGGYPVAFSSEIEIDTSRPFWGLSFDLGTFAERWDFNTFYITQDVDGIRDREAIGGEVRYFAPGLSFFGLVDYDISYNQLNIALLNGNWSMTQDTTINVAMDYRQSPILTTSNALQGQIVTTIDQLMQGFSEDQVRQLALDRTIDSRSFTLGVNHSLNPNLQVSADVTVSKFSGAPTSGGVEGYPSTGYEYFYSLQFIGSSLIKEGDIAIVGLRYSDTSTARTYSLNLNTRYPITRNLRVNPQFLVDYRTAHNSSREQLKLRPLVRLEYRWKRRYNLEFEGGLEFSTEETSTTVDDRRGYFFTIGYRIDF